MPIVEKASKDKQATSLDHQQHLLMERNLGLDQAGEHLAHADTVCFLPMREGGQENCIHRTIKVSTAEPSGTSDSHRDKDASLKEEALPGIRSVCFKLASLGSNSSFQGRQLLLTHGSFAGKFKYLAFI